jgi:hypothetical protein
MQIVLSVVILAIIAVGMIAIMKLSQFKNPKAAMWYYIGAYCIANGDAEMRRIERQHEHYQIMESMCGGKVSARREAQA